jgi:hypothetical protein
MSDVDHVGGKISCAVATAMCVVGVTQRLLSGLAFMRARVLTFQTRLAMARCPTVHWRIGRGSCRKR